MMRWWGRATLTIILAGCLSSCASLEDKQWYQDAKSTSAKAFNSASDSTAKAMKRMQQYAAEQDVLMKFHDAGEHSEREVLDILHKSGVGHSKSGTAAKGSAASGTVSSASVAAGKSGAGSATPTVASNVPAQYSGPIRWPVEAGIVSSKYGPRWGKMHKGLDIAADSGEPVYAIASGDVIYAGDGLRGYGNVVIVQHDKQMTSLYAHNSELKVHQGDHVKQGTVLALLGNTGHSTGPHVHFEIRQGDAAVDPMGLLPASMVADTHDPSHDPHRQIAASAK